MKKRGPVRLEIPVEADVNVLISVELPRELIDGLSPEQERSLRRMAEEAAADFMEKKIGRSRKLVALKTKEWRWREIGRDTYDVLIAGRRRGV